jgi:putative sterol carrier protein
MSEIVAAAVKALNERLGADGLDGTVDFVIEDEGTVRIDESGAVAGNGGGEADCTLTASADTFRALLDGDIDPTAAFMSGQLAVDGDMGLAMRLASRLG